MRGQAEGGANWVCSVNDACEGLTVVNNTDIVTVTGTGTGTGTEPALDPSPWGCQYVRTYTVAGNSPPGLRECMEKSMNRTAAHVHAHAERAPGRVSSYDEKMEAIRRWTDERK